MSGFKRTSVNVERNLKSELQTIVYKPVTYCCRHTSGSNQSELTHIPLQLLIESINSLKAEVGWTAFPRQPGAAVKKKKICIVFGTFFLCVIGLFEGSDFVSVSIVWLVIVITHNISEGPHKDRSSVWVLKQIAAVVCLLRIETIFIELIGDCTPPIVHTHTHTPAAGVILFLLCCTLSRELV